MGFPHQTDPRAGHCGPGVAHREPLPKPGCVAGGGGGVVPVQDKFHNLYLSPVLLFSLLLRGVTWLAGISLLSPVRISVLDEHHGQSDLKGRAVPEASPLPACGELDSFAIPESLDQHVTLVPSKLRLVTLAAFILQKCKVGLH